MSEPNLSIASIRLLKRRSEVSNNEKLKDKIKKPERPANAVSYQKASEYGNELTTYNNQIKNKDRRIQEINREISELERDIKNNMPVQNVSIKVSGKYNNEEYNLIVTHVKSDHEDRIEVETQ